MIYTYSSLYSKSCYTCTLSPFSKISENLENIKSRVKNNKSGGTGTHKCSSFRESALKIMTKMLANQTQFNGPKVALRLGNTRLFKADLTALHVSSISVWCKAVRAALRSLTKHLDEDRTSGKVQNSTRHLKFCRVGKPTS